MVSGQLSWVSSCEVHKTKWMTRVPIPTQLGYFKQAAGLFFCCSRKQASRSRSRESDCAARRPARCGRCELRCELRPELRPGLRPELRCELRAIWMRREAPQARKILVYWHGNSHGGGSLLLSLPLSLPPSLPLFLCLPPPPSPLPFVPADTAGQLRPPHSVPYTTHRPHSEAWRH